MSFRNDIYLALVFNKPDLSAVAPFFAEVKVINYGIRTIARTDISRKTQSQKTLSRMDTILNGHHPEWHNPNRIARSRMDTIPNAHNPEWTQSRIDIIPNEHLHVVT